MGVLTGLILGGFVVYVAGWLADAWVGDLPLMLLLLTAVTFLYWLAERLWFKPRRAAAARRLEDQVREREARLAGQGVQGDHVDVAAAREQLLAQPWWLDWTAGIFPIILVVFLARSFLFEPFKIPSGSMIPTLQVGDLILVNKFHYGLRLPVANTLVWANHKPRRGDVIVFHYPLDPRQDYIKRVVGVPGDEVAYLDKKLTLNGQPVAEAPAPDYYDAQSLTSTRRLVENLDGVQHDVILHDDVDRVIPSPAPDAYAHRDQCRYRTDGVVCKVPPGNYFMMGDNRDESADSRYWGFVPEENIVGKAFLIWMNFHELGRIGTFFR